jgi:hypothetical protein
MLKHKITDRNVENSLFSTLTMVHETFNIMSDDRKNPNAHQKDSWHLLEKRRADRRSWAQMGVMVVNVTRHNK